MMSEDASVNMVINGVPRSTKVEPRETLLDFLRDNIGLMGPKKGCDESVCGACAVLVNGEAVCSCTMLAVEAEGTEVTTIEGLVDKDGRLDPLQAAFVAFDSLQCGFCTSGQIISAKSYLSTLPPDTIPTEAEVREALSGNLCRCGCYLRIVEAVRSVASRGRRNTP